MEERNCPLLGVCVCVWFFSPFSLSRGFFCSNFVFVSSENRTTPFVCEKAWSVSCVGLFLGVQNWSRLFVREIAWSVSCAISLRGVLFLFFFSRAAPQAHMTTQWGWTGNWWSKTQFRTTHSPAGSRQSLLHHRNPKVPFLMWVHDIVCVLDAFEEEISPLEVVLSEGRAVFVYWVCVFPGWLQRGLLCSSFLLVWSAICDHWVRRVYGWFFNSSFPCRSFLWRRVRSLFAVLSVKTRNGALGLSARRVISYHKSGWFQI